MNQAGTHYEQAFESFLRRYRLPYVVVDQARKAVFAGVALKSFDFIVYTKVNMTLLADVKGRKLSFNTFARGHLGQNWTTADDVDSLGDWQRVFGDGHVAIFVFAYWLFDKPDSKPVHLAHRDDMTTAQLYHFQGRDYVFVAVKLSDYRMRMQIRSEKWNTVFVPTISFRHIVRPCEQFIANPR